MKPKPSAAEVVQIAPDGDLIVHVQGKEDSDNHDFRVSSAQLSKASPYFASILDPDKFREGAKIRDAHNFLLQNYKTLSEVPGERLPRINLEDLGRISQVSSIQPVAKDFLSILHNIDVFTKQPPIANIANLTVVADRYDALKFFSQYVSRRGFLRTIETKNKSKDNSTEERVRQMLMVGVLLDYKPFFGSCSKKLIMNGSSRWQFQTNEGSSLPLWWSMPNCIEDELLFRRDCVLETINSIQQYFLERYTSRDRQCKLGYDSSAQCDSFQLGEMIKFFTRIKTLRLQGSIFDDNEIVPFSEDIERLIGTLRQCPAYQITPFHAHCGLRARLIPILDFIQSLLSSDPGKLSVGICADCWQNHRVEYAWYGAKRPISWVFSNNPQPDLPLSVGSVRNKCLAKHLAVREIFMANERCWEHSPL